jgi:hypothetical protein
MIRNFETQTEPLTLEERELLPKFIRGLRTKIGKSNAITNKQIRTAFAEKENTKISDTRVRKIINHIRITGLVPYLCATSNGYYVAETHEEIYDYLKSLHERIAAQMKVYNVLHDQMQKMNKSNK